MLVAAIRVILLVIRVILRPNSRQWFTTSFLRRRCRKAMLGVCSLVSFKCGGSNNTSDTIGDTSDTVGNTSDNYGYYVCSCTTSAPLRCWSAAETWVPSPCLSDTAHHFPLQTLYFWFGFDCRTGYDSGCRGAFFFLLCAWEMRARGWDRDGEGDNHMCLLFISSPGFYVTLCIVKRFLCQKSRRSSKLPLLLWW